MIQRARSFRLPRPPCVGLADVGLRADDLAAAGEVRRGQQRKQLVVAQLASFFSSATVAAATSRRLWLGTSVARPTAMPGAVEQHEGQPRRQLLRLFGAAVVVGLEVDRAFVDLVQHQPGDGRQARLGVAHRSRAVAVAAAEVALAVDQRVALRKVLRHAHQRVVGRGVAVRVVAAQHVAHDARALHRLGRRRRR
jgi:hypothetical protein